MTAKKIVTSAARTALVLTGDYAAADAVAEFTVRCIDEKAFSLLSVEEEKAKERMYTRYLTAQLGYTPSQSVLNFISYYKL